ncbi:MAG: RelA/SpoT family protein [Patescibacteria group bacterium]
MIIDSSIDAFSNELLEKIHGYSSEIDLSRIKSAYEFAKKAHQGQLRQSGEPYLMHPMRTVQILTNFRVDEDTLAAAFLHDVPEDTDIPISEIERLFGSKIAYLVDGITKLSKVHYRERMEQRQIESLKKLFIHSAQDLRVILIKLADRLDNMRTLNFIAGENKRHRIARETLEIYVPIANLLGIGEIRTELEDLCFEHLFPMDFAHLKREVEENLEERDFILKEMIHLTEKELQKRNLEAEIIGRPKTLYSIYRKLQTKQTLNNIDDLLAIRVMVPTRSDCYNMLGIVHQLFKPKIGRMKDYIAVPKPNGYQSLHTTVFGLSGSIAEFQIRTRYMHLEAEYGIAAHYFYKYSDEQELANIMQQKSSWVQRILEMQKDNNDQGNFIENLKLDVFQDRIFVFSPKGDVIDLPRGACTLDFAYAIHTDVGNHAVKAEINGVMFPVNTTLVSGDTVRIISSKDSHPEREWLNCVKTSVAAHRIKEYLRNEPMEKKLALGRKFLQKEFDRIGKDFQHVLTSKRIKIIAEKLPYHRLDHILVAIGEGQLQPQSILEILFETKELFAGPDEHLTNQRDHGRNPLFRSRAGLRILGSNHQNQFREIMRTMNSLHIPIVKFIVDKPWYLNHDRCQLSVMVKNYNELAQVFESLEQIEGVQQISRLFYHRKAWFIFWSIFTSVMWLIHPFIVDWMLTNAQHAGAITNLSIYAGLVSLIGLSLYLKKTARRSFPELAEIRHFWPFLYGLTTLALFVFIGEILTFKLQFNWMFVLFLIVGIYALLTASYLSYRKEQFK